MVVHMQGNLTKGEGSVQLTSIEITSLVHMLLILQTLFTFKKEQATLMRSSVLILQYPHSVSVPCVRSLVELKAQSRFRPVS
jgi:hypothetical protein